MWAGRLFTKALVIAVTLSLARADEACSGHGSLVDSKCVCSTPLPEDGSPGFVGNKCGIPVYQLSINGKDVQETCSQGHICNVVTPTGPVCFSTGIEDLGSSAFHLNLLLSSSTVDATVVLHGLLTNFTSQDPAKLVPQAYPNSDTPYSFAVHTVYGSPGTQLKLTRRQLGYGAYTGMYVCATTNATTTIILRAAEHACPFDLSPSGAIQLCSGRGTSDSCPHGMCMCTPPYNPPANWVMTPGLGFEDCSAALVPLQLSVPQTVPELAAGGWTFFRIELPETSGRELHVWAAATEATRGSLVLYLRHQQLPGDAADQHDLASGSAPSWHQDQSVHLTLRRKPHLLQSGTWYLGVHNVGVGPVPFTIGAAAYDCPNNCSGRGSCDATTATCTCSEPTSHAAAADCSIALHEPALGQQLVAPPRDFTYDTVVLPAVRDALERFPAAVSRLNLTVSFTTTDAAPTGLPAWAVGRPVVFAAPSLEAELERVVAAGASGPLRPPGGEESLVLVNRGVSYSMEIGPWAVSEDGSLQLVVWNPLSSPLRQVGYSLVVELQAECPADCSGRGACNTTTGECVCEAPFLGSDCSVDPAAFACAPGTRRAVRPEGLRGVCWAPCRADGRGFDDTNCDDLQCDGPGGGHGQLRRKGGEMECVEDACVAGNYTVTDSSGDFLCTHLCACPPDGSACALESTCLPGTKQCLKGLRLAADGESCVAALCEEGSLRWAYDLDGGSAFAACVCAAAGDPTSCAFTAPTLAAGNENGLVSCGPGFERQGSTTSMRLSDGSLLLLGGRCDRPRRRGVSGGMVFFYCLLSIFLASGLVVGGKYGVLWYEQYRYGKSVFSQGYVSWPLFGNRGNAGSGTDDW